MKYRFYSIGIISVLVSALFVLTACSSDDEDSPKPISFSASLNAITRTSVVNGTTFPEADFRVYGFLPDGTLYMGNSTGGTSTAEHVKYGAGAYRPSSDYYWPVGKTLNFYAAYPHSLTGFGVNDGKVHIDYTVPAEVANQVDVLYAVAPNASESSGATPLSFRHALSQLHFKGKIVTPRMKATVKQIKVQNISIREILTLPTTSTASAEGTWSDNQGALTHEAQPEFIVELPSGSSEGQQVDLTKDGEQLLVIPQAETPWNKDTHQSGTYLEIICQISVNKVDYVGSRDAGGNVTAYDTIFVPLAVNWKQGKNYTYELEFGFGQHPEGGATTVTVDVTGATVNDWGGSTSENVDAIHY